MEIRMLEVDFLKYCKICKYREKDGNEEPCRECLEWPYNRNRERPYNFEENAKK